MWRSLNIKLLGKQANLLLKMAMNPVRIYQDLLLVPANQLTKQTQ